MRDEPGITAAIRSHRGVGAATYIRCRFPVSGGGPHRLVPQRSHPRIGGKRVRIDVYSKKQILDVATGLTKLHVLVPKQVNFSVVAQDEGFGEGWDIRFDPRERLQADKDNDTIEIQAEVFVPTPEDVRLPVKVLISDPGEIEVTDDGDVVDKGRDDKVLEAHGPSSRGNDEEAWTNEWITMPPVTIK